jgi:NAD(P)-dependent dehydrogenase (short-subunit alcohol dehydrogenase family)
LPSLAWFQSWSRYCSNSVLIPGANRGIGFNLARAFAERSWTVYGSVRPQTIATQDETVKEVGVIPNVPPSQIVANSHRKLENIGATILEIDVANESTIVTAAEGFGPEPLDLLINVAGKSEVYRYGKFRALTTTRHGARTGWLA